MRAGKATFAPRSLSAKGLKATVIRHKAEREAAKLEKVPTTTLKPPAVANTAIKKFIDLPAWARKAIKAEGERIVLLPTNPTEQQSNSNSFAGIQAFQNFSASTITTNPDVLKSAVFFERPYVRKAMQHAKQIYIVFREASNPFWIFESICEAPAKGDILNRIKPVSKVAASPQSAQCVDGLDDGEAYVVTTTRDMSRAVQEIVAKHGGNADFKDLAVGTTIGKDDVVQATIVLNDAMTDEIASLNTEAKPTALCFQPDFTTETTSVMAPFLYRTAKKFDPKNKVSQLTAVQSVVGIAAALHRWGYYCRVQGYQLFVMATSQEMSVKLQEFLVEHAEFFPPVPFVRDAWGTRALAPSVHNEAATREEQAFLATAEKMKKESEVLILIEVMDKPVDTRKNFEKIAAHLGAKIVSNRSDQCVLAVVLESSEIVTKKRMAFTRRQGGPVAFEASVFHREDGDLDADAAPSASSAAAAAPTATV